MAAGPQVAVVDCGLGNIAAVVNMLRRAGALPLRTGEPEALEGCAAVVLPGVGSFDAGVARLRSTGMWDALLGYASTGRPLLGVCLGMQLLAAGSEEGRSGGLGLVDARFERFPDSARKVPHTGWNTVSVPQSSPLFSVEEAVERRFYFVHSYFAVCGPRATTLATATYGQSFPCAYRQGNVYGVQFHPEKSHRFGLAMLQRFLGRNA